MAPPIPLLPSHVAAFAGAGGPTDGAVALTAADQVDADGTPLAAAAAAFFLNGGRTLHLASTLDALRDIDEITIVAAPTDASLSRAEHAATAAALVAHADACGQRFAVVDAPFSASVAEVTAFRQPFEAAHAALYHPWVEAAGGTGPVAPSGAVAGVLSRTPTHQRAAGVDLAGVASLATPISRTTTELLNPHGVNVLRSFPGGIKVWGGRTMSSDPAWRYVDASRTLLSLEHAIERGTRWAVAEPNGEALWTEVRTSIEDFLGAQWRGGVLAGDRGEEAYFVRCDRTTMTQDDLDRGRLVCLVGIAPARPAEFVILRIGQWTADRDDD